MKGGNEMSSYVVDGAKLKCPFGDKESKLRVTKTRRVYINNRRQGNIMDFKPKENILSFGDCSSLANPVVAAATAANHGRLQKMPCVPATVSPWINGKTDVLVGNFPAILDTSKLMCMWCGVISVAKDGQ
jgi:hypothetical protein